MNSTPPAPKPLAPSTNGVANSEASARSAGRGTQQDYFPDFGAPANVLVLLVVSGVAAIMLSLARDYSAEGFLSDLGKTSMLVMWLAVSSAGILALARPRFVRLTVSWSTALALFLVLANTVLCSELIYQLGDWFGDQSLAGPAGMFPAERWLFISRNVALTMLVTGVVLRYFYVTHQWRSNVEKEAESRVAALQARIRPHFLFNSMNTIASLTRSDPAAAEQAVEDLADLLRASLGKPGESISLAEELEVTRVYQRMEEQRLGDRLTVDWQLDELPMHTRIPGLTIQPLLENAIYHGIEPLPEGGVITVKGEATADRLTITVSNPVGTGVRSRNGKGHQLALDNIRQRLELAYGTRAQMEIDSTADNFRVRVGFPVAA
jgi:two-component system sensor histidine kinase AlgZ